MANPQELKKVRQKLIETLGCHPTRVSQLISEKAKHGPMARDEAILVLAYERGIDLAKFVGSDDMAVVRGMTSRGDQRTPRVAQPAKASQKKPRATLAKLNTVFIVHGRDSAAKKQVSEYVNSLGLKAIILHEQPNMGRTIVKKLEDHSNVACAIVLLTPDDIGSINSEKVEIQTRARQNVIYELGYFVGKLTRARVVALYVAGVELPSDLDGVLYVPFDEDWQQSLFRELKAMRLGL